MQLEVIPKRQPNFQGAGSTSARKKSKDAQFERAQAAPAASSLRDPLCIWHHVHHCLASPRTNLADTLECEFVYAKRALFWQNCSCQRENHIYTRQDSERNAYVALVALSAWKCVMASTAEELASVLILYTKFFSLCMLYWKVGFWRSMLYIVGWICKRGDMT